MIIQFERYNNEIGKFYYSVHKDPLYLVKELKKLGASDYIIKNKLWETMHLDNEILFLGITATNNVTQWLLRNEGKIFVDKGFEYKGTVKLSSKELNDINTEKTAEKYNL